MSKLKKHKRESRRAALDALTPKPICRNCGERGHHFVPPSMGESGFFACQRNESQDEKP